MRTTDALASLHEHQERLLGAMAQSVRLLDGDALLVRPELARSRWRMMRELRAYQIFKHTEIFDPVLAHGPAEHVEGARTMKARCIAAGERYGAYALRWSSVDIASCWNQYRPAMLKMVQELSGHIARERQEITAFLADTHRTRRHLKAL